MKLSEATKLITILAAYWPNRELPPETFQLWAPELEGVDSRDGMAAVRSLALSSRFMPTLAELLEAADEERKQRVRQEMGERVRLPGERYDFDGWIKAAEAEPWRKLIDQTIPAEEDA